MPEEPNPDSIEPTQEHQEAPPSSTGSSEPTFITLTKLIEERPWSKAMVGEFLGEPDRTAPNPNYRSASPMRLYDLKRIEQAEATPEFALRQARYEVKKKAALERSSAKRERLIAGVREIEIQYYFPMTVEEARENGLNAWADWEDEKNSRRGNFEGPAFRTPEFYAPEDIDRWAVNWLRHEQSGYEAILNGIRGLVGRKLADPIIKNRVLHHISETFPELAPAANLQLMPEETAPPARPKE